MTPEQEREVRAKRRECDAAHDAIEAELAQLQAEYDALCEEVAPLLVREGEIDAHMTALKADVHSKRLELAALLEKHRD